jgi:hypothetical protein
MSTKKIKGRPTLSGIKMSGKERVKKYYDSDGRREAHNKKMREYTIKNRYRINLKYRLGTIEGKLKKHWLARGLIKME